MKKFFKSKIGKGNKSQKEDKDVKDQKEIASESASESDNLVKCMDCGNRAKLFYDLSASTRDEGEE